MYLGLKLALKDDISQLCVESDSKFVIDMVTHNCKMNETTPMLIRRNQNILNHSWHI